MRGLMAGKQTIRIGGVPEHFNLPWHLAIETNALAASGLEVDWIDYSTGSGAMLADLVDARLDLAMLLTEGAALGLASRLPIAAISLYTRSPLIWGVHVPPGSRYKALRDLQHAHFGISRRGSGSHLMSLALAIEQGWPVAKLQFEIVDDLAGAVAAFDEGRADVFLWEHFTTQPAVDAGHFRCIDDFVAPWPAWVFCARQSVLQEFNTEIDAMFSIVAGTAQDLARSRDAAGLIAMRYGLEQAAVKRWLAMTRWVEGIESPKKALDAAEAMLRQAGAISA